MMKIIHKMYYEGYELFLQLEWILRTTCKIDPLNKYLTVIILNSLIIHFA